METIILDLFGGNNRFDVLNDGAGKAWSSVSGLIPTSVNGYLLLELGC